MYITFLGDISRNYDMACSSFIKCLQKVEMDLCKPIFGNTISQFDYLQHEKLRVAGHKRNMDFSILFMVVLSMLRDATYEIRMQSSLPKVSLGTMETYIYDKLQHIIHVINNI